MKKILIVTLLIISLYNCERVTMDKKYAVYLNNNVDYSIGCYFALGCEFGTLYPDTLKNDSWENIRDNYKVPKRYDLSLDDLKNMDWTINYP